MFLFFFIFIFGLIVGSFLNCVIYRLAAPERGEPRPDGSGREKGKSFLRGRSYCPHCKHILNWLDLIPVLSFLLLRGRCRYCQKKISYQYPLVELSTGIIFVLLLEIRSPIIDIWEIGYLSIVACFLVIIFVYDLKHYIIPDRVVYPAIVIAGIYDLLKSDFQWKSDFLISAFGAALFFGAIVLISRGRWMGIGDIKLAFLMGLILGWPEIISTLFLAFFLGAIIGAVLILSRRKKLRSEVPFGPFLVTGTFLSLFWGGQIINWYLNLIR